MTIINYDFCSFWTFSSDEKHLWFSTGPQTLQGIGIALGYHPDLIAEQTA